MGSSPRPPRPTPLLPPPLPLLAPLVFSFLIGMCLATPPPTPTAVYESSTTRDCNCTAYCESCDGPNEYECVPDLTKPGCRPPPPTLVLAAQIVLGAAMVMALAALVSVILRMCTRRAAANRTRSQSQRSATSLEAFVAQRLHDCPPQYDEISWEKPPSYAAVNSQERTNAGETTDSSTPPAYDGPFTISRAAAQLRTTEDPTAQSSSPTAQSLPSNAV